MNDSARARPVLLSIVTPAFDEAESLPALHERLAAALAPLALDWEWIVVDDHSRDGTFAWLAAAAAADRRVRGLRLARNSGSHAAIAGGLAAARGDAAVVLVADGQDPPEIVPRLLDAWRAGAQVVWAARDAAAKPPWSSRLYYRLMRRLSGLEGLAPSGADCVLLDRAAVDAVGEFPERHVSLFALLAWMGFRQASVPSPRQPRRAGRSGWTRARRVELFVDSLTAFTHFPIRLMSLLGATTAAAGFLYALVVVVNALAGRPPAGWSSLMVAILLLGGGQMLMLGVLGEYLWRALGESRRRPRFQIEATTDGERAAAAERTE